MHSTFMQTPVHYTLLEFSVALARYSQSLWRPAFPTLHNTGVPNLSQWVAMGATPQERWGANLNRYYSGLGWHAGPHLVVCPDYVWVLSDLAKPGVSVSCWNAKTVGVEMVGNYEIGGDEFTSGLGARVRENAVQVIAMLANVFHWGDLSDYFMGERGLHFHRECARDHHACPGSRVDKHDVVAQVQRIRGSEFSTNEGLTGISLIATPVPVMTSGGDAAIKILQSDLKILEPDLALRIDGVLGSETRSALTAFQKKHDLLADWEPGARTRALLADLAAHAG